VTRDCLFCAIAAGEEPAHVVASEPHGVAFLDIRPLFHGHVLLVPRVHVPTLKDLPADLLQPWFSMVQRIERAVETAMSADGSLMLVNNVVSQSVPHVHVHVIPRRRRDGLRFWLGPRVRYDDEQHAASVAAAIGAAYLEA
jgi:histidine triad (HIT) family protein